MTREQLENHIATVSKDIDILNCRIAEAEKQLQMQATHKKRPQVRKLFAFSCKAGELQEKLQENQTMIEELLQEYQKKAVQTMK